MFVRFVVGGDDEHHRDLTGLITEARLLRDRGRLASHETEQVENVFEWFNKNVPCPPFSTAGWSRDAVSWFKDSAREPIKRIRVLAALLNLHDKPVRMLRSARPGNVLYEDRVQVVVEEWKRL